MAEHDGELHDAADQARGGYLALEHAADGLATHLRAFGEHHLASALDGAKQGTRSRYPQRVLGLFRHGMGGLLDVPLYRDGVLDRDATERRDALAECLHELAMTALQ